MNAKVQMPAAISAQDVAARAALPIAGCMRTHKPSIDVRDTPVTGARRVVLWGQKDWPIMRMEIDEDQPLTVGQLVRALQCGYLASANRASRWGDHAGLVRDNVVAGCRIATDAMPHRVTYRPSWKVALTTELVVDGYDAVLNDDGQLDVMLRLAPQRQTMEQRLAA